MKQRNDSYQTRILDMLSTQELERLLNTELRKASVDEILVYEILCVLKERENPTNDAETEADIINDEARQNAEPRQPKQSVLSMRLTKVVAAVAVFCLLITVTPVVLGAENIIELVGRWSQDIFALFWTDDQAELGTDYVFRTDHPGLQELYDTVAEAGITQRVVPMWVPEECELVELMTWDTQEGTKVQAKLADNNCRLLIVFEPYTNKPSTNYHKDDVDAITCDTGGNKHYMVPNDGNWTVVWSAEDIECLIVTTYDESTIYKILDSIYAEGA